MSHYYFYQPSYYYDPRLLGHPHEPSETQLTEPFWQQYPPWARVGKNPYTHQLNPFYNMDSQTVFIGSKTKNGRKATEAEKERARQDQLKRSTRPLGKVDLYIDGEFIKEMPLGTLVRFSKVAAAAFPKPEDAKKSDHATAADRKAASRNWADDDENDDSLDVEKLTADVAKLKTSSEAEAPTPTIVNGSRSATTAAPKATNSNKELELRWNDLNVQPSTAGFIFAFEWMHKAKESRPGESVPDYGVPEPDKISLEMLIDMYAAALCLDLRPFPHKHRHDILTRLTASRPLLQQVGCVFDHMPLQDPVVTRMITSCLQYRQRSRGTYTALEWKMVQDYVYSEPSLLNRFEEIETARQESWKARKERKGEEHLQELAQQRDPNPVAGPSKSPVRAVEDQVTNGGVGNEQGGGRRRNRRHQERKGKDGKGNTVPGAHY